MRLITVCETKAWVWTVAGRPGHDEVVVGCDGGSIRMHKLQFQHVTAIYKVGDRAYPLQLEYPFVGGVIRGTCAQIELCDELAVGCDEGSIRLHKVQCQHVTFAAIQKASGG